MAQAEKKILKALVEIGKTVEKLDGTLDKMDCSESKAKHFIEQEKAIHEIKEIVRASNRLDKFEEKDLEEWAKKVTKDVDGQAKALSHIGDAADKLEAELAKIGDDDGKVKSFVAQKKVIHQVKKILHACNLYEKFVADEIDDL